MTKVSPPAKTVLVVGGTSFIALHALPRLVAVGYDVHATRRSHGPAPPLAGVHWVAGNLAGPDPTAGWPAKCDAVIYLAQSREWRRFPEGAADVFDVNVRGVLHAVEYARRVGAGHFIFASTGSVHPPGETPARECDPLDVLEPRPFYVAAKLSAELMLRSYAGPMSVVILRLFVPYGEREAADMLIPQLVHKVRAAKAILLDGEDGLKINPVAAADVAEAIERCLRLTHSATLNVAGPDLLTLRQVGQAIGKVLRLKPKFEMRSGPAPVIVGDTSELRKSLGWAPPTTFENGLRVWLRDPDE